MTTDKEKNTGKALAIHSKEESSHSSSWEQEAEASPRSSVSAPLSGPGDLTLKSSLCNKQIPK